MTATEEGLGVCVHADMMAPWPPGFCRETLVAGVTCMRPAGSPSGTRAGESGVAPAQRAGPDAPVAPQRVGQGAAGPDSRPGRRRIPASRLAPAPGWRSPAAGRADHRPAYGRWVAASGRGTAAGLELEQSGHAGRRPGLVQRRRQRGIQGAPHPAPGARRGPWADPAAAPVVACGPLVRPGCGPRVTGRSAVTGRGPPIRGRRSPGCGCRGARNKRAGRPPGSAGRRMDP